MRNWNPETLEVISAFKTLVTLRILKENYLFQSLANSNEHMFPNKNNMKDDFAIEIHHPIRSLAFLAIF